MSDPIRDLDDVEAQAWFHAWCIARERENAACDRSAEVADECVRLLRERRAKPSAATMVSLATQLAAACGREANAVAVERAKVVAWLKSTPLLVEGSIAKRSIVDAIERGEHDR